MNETGYETWYSSEWQDDGYGNPRCHPNGHSGRSGNRAQFNFVQLPNAAVSVAIPGYQHIGDISAPSFVHAPAQPTILHGIHRQLLFKMPALTLVWSIYLRGLEPTSLRSVTSLQGAARIVCVRSYRHGTSHALGIWANFDDTPLRPGLWDWEQKLAGVFRVGGLFGTGHGTALSWISGGELPRW